MSNPASILSSPEPSQRFDRGIIVHEWIERRGGAEKVVDEFAAAFPNARILCLWNDAPGRFDDERVRESWLARTPLRNSKSMALPFMPATWRRLGEEDVDWILVSSHLFAHHARFQGEGNDAKKFVYVHTPARYIWEPGLDARGDGPIARAASRLLKPLDRKRAHEADSMAANSEFVRQRIQRCWEVDSRVIYPPVDVAAYARDSHDELSAEEESILFDLPSEFILGASRFVPYKQLDAVIRVGAGTGLPVVLAGDGPSSGQLRAMADELGADVTFIRSPSVPLLSALYRRAIAYVFPPVEDFGIMPVEAMAAGTPVIARSVGGVSESVQHGRTGVLLDSFDPMEVRNALDQASRIDPAACVDRAMQFGIDEFHEAVTKWVR